MSSLFENVIAFYHVSNQGKRAHKLCLSLCLCVCIHMSVYKDGAIGLCTYFGVNYSFIDNTLHQDGFERFSSSHNVLQVPQRKFK